MFGFKCFDLCTSITAKYWILLFFAFFNGPTCAQKQGHIWYFARQLGLNFNDIPPTVLMDGQVDFDDGGTEGCGTIASANGNLLFYANGEYIWNRKHEIMLNGNGLMGHRSSTNGAVIVPNPGENAKYYVFTTHAWQEELPNGLRYSIVDMCGDGGFGEVIAASKNILLLDGAGEKLAVTKHADGVNYWLIAHKHFSNIFQAYLITESGISAPVISEIGTVHGNLAYRDDLRGYQDAIGQMKISPDGTKLALVMENRSPDVIDLFNFDPSSGVLNDYRNLSDGSESGGIYGVAFSPDQSQLYVQGRDGLFQFSLDAGTQQEIIQSKYKIHTAPGYMGGGLQLGPDGKIYAVRGYYAGIIENPNLQGEACNFIDNAIYFQEKFVHHAFPTFIDDFDYPNKGNVPFGIEMNDESAFCIGKVLDLREHTSGDELSFLWQDGSTNPVYDFQAAGEYSVTISDRFCTVEKNFTISSPFNSLGPDTTACQGDTVILVSDILDGSYQWQNGSEEPSLPVYEPGTYWIEISKDECIARDSIEVSFLPLPRFSLGKDTTLCHGESLSVSINVTADQYEWQDGSTDATFTISQAGTYLGIAKLNGCYYSDEINVEYATAPSIQLGEDTLICEGSFLKITLEEKNAYYWNDGSISNVLTIREPGEYWVLASVGNCTSTDTLSVELVDCVISLPNFFTPNGDKFNEVFIPMEMSGISAATLSVYNRWGMELFQTDNFSFSNGWDGTHNNNPVTPGIYFWEVQYTTIEKRIHILKGTLTLSR